MLRSSRDRVQINCVVIIIFHTIVVKSHRDSFNIFVPDFIYFDSIK